MTEVEALQQIATAISSLTYAILVIGGLHLIFRD